MGPVRPAASSGCGRRSSRAGSAGGRAPRRAAVRRPSPPPRPVPPPTPRRRRPRDPKLLPGRRACSSRRSLPGPAARAPPVPRPGPPRRAGAAVGCGRRGAYGPPRPAGHSCLGPPDGRRAAPPSSAAPRVYAPRAPAAAGVRCRLPARRPVAEPVPGRRACWCRRCRTSSPPRAAARRAPATAAGCRVRRSGSRSGRAAGWGSRSRAAGGRGPAPGRART